jgi:hypothetical protein
MKCPEGEVFPGEFSLSVYMCIYDTCSESSRVNMKQTVLKSVIPWTINVRTLLYKEVQRELIPKDLGS